MATCGTTGVVVADFGSGGVPPFGASPRVGSFGAAELFKDVFADELLNDELFADKGE